MTVACLLAWPDAVAISVVALVVGLVIIGVHGSAPR